MPTTLAERDVVLVTLDSCRYDVAVSARLPSLRTLGAPVRAEAAGTYTLPAHSAMFNGFLPRPYDGVFRIGRTPYKALWRSVAARQTPEQVAMPFQGRTIMEHYQRRGWRVVGAGGVTFFDRNDPNNSLPALFPEFRYYGRSSRPGGGRGGPVDRDGALTLSHVRELADLCLRAERFFLFINCPSTHIPYTTPFAPLTASAERLLAKLYRLHDAKKPTSQVPGLLSSESVQLLAMQRRALEWADQQLGVLFHELRHRAPLVVVCADHGEEFGEGGRYGHAHAHPTVTDVPLWCGTLE